MGGGGKTIELAIDFDKLRDELSENIIADKRERYQFTWPLKREAAHLANTPTTMTLRPCREESVDFDTTQNLYIEGDNLEVLKVLRETYLNKVKLIYIDPPYNTGHDFVYRDNFTQSTEEYLTESGEIDEEGNRLFVNTESNGRFHTDWLNMMYPRLKVARDLLTEDGVIFISIDDHEVDNLKKICNEIYGEGNFVFTIAWRRTDNQSNIGNTARVKEYIVCFAKSRAQLAFGKLPLSEKAKKEYRYSDAKGLFRRSILLDKTRGRMFYPKETPSGKILNGPWMVSMEEFDRMAKSEEIYWTSGGDEQPYGKIYLADSKGQIPNDFWDIDFGTNQRASLEVEVLFNKRLFDFPKPVSLLYNLLSFGASRDSVILDFFSGSATTAHAVMQLNVGDGGKRKFIMVQLPEQTDKGSEAYKDGYKNICEIGRERIRRAARRIQEEYPMFKETIDTGFRVLKLDTSNMQDLSFTPKEFGAQQTLSVDNIKLGRTSEDLLFQTMLSLGIPLSEHIETNRIDGKTVYEVRSENKYLIACFDERVNESTLTEIAKLRPDHFVMRDASAADDSVIDNCEQIFRHYSPQTDCSII